MNDVITLVDEPDQADLSARLQSVSLRYQCHCFHSQCYPVQRWLDDRALQLCSMPPSAVLVTHLQVNLCHTCVSICSADRITCSPFPDGDTCMSVETLFKTFLVRVREDTILVMYCDMHLQYVYMNTYVLVYLHVHLLP